jgi:hypothetical protein
MSNKKLKSVYVFFKHFLLINCVFTIIFPKPIFNKQFNYITIVYLFYATFLYLDYFMFLVYFCSSSPALFNSNFSTLSLLLVVYLLLSQIGICSDTLSDKASPGICYPSLYRLPFSSFLKGV